MPLSYGTIAVEHWRDENTCAATTSPSALDADCVESDTCGNDVVFCTPACTIDTDVDGTCDGDQHNPWRPEGPVIVDAFFRRTF